MGGFFGVVAYSIFNYRRKAADTKTSVYVIQTRVAAQGLVISFLALGACYKMYQSYVDRDVPKINAFHRTDDSVNHQNENHHHDLIKHNHDHHNKAHK